MYYGLIENKCMTLFSGERERERERERDSFSNLFIDFFIGYLNIYSSFNRRKWGKRWCAVKDNVFECYKNKSSTVCELELPLRPCVLRQAVQETKSELGLMLSQNGMEKITVEVKNMKSFRDMHAP